MPGRPGNAFVILNASSGWDKKDAAPALVRAVLRTHGIECTVTKVTAGADIRAIASRAVAEGAELVVAGGGDGTLRAVAAGLSGTGVPMAVLPVGTLNHFARDMEIPFDLEQAATVAAAGTAVTVDVGEVNGRVFINNSVIGLYPTYRFERARREARGWNGKLAILGGIYSVFRRFPFLEVRLDAGDVTVARRSPYIVIANNEHAMEGFKPWQRDRMTDGMLWVYISRARSRFDLLRLVFKVLTGRLRTEDEFEVLRAGRVRVAPHRRRIGVSLDGEVVSMETPLEYRSRPRELRVMVPPGSRRVEEFVCETGGVPSAP
ncbi:MAG TPA: diacylglycerol kinase family protein [Bryobacteraceae bacterium]|nr:diacylglycerol kinase family protein [Bryobacteraceae bacterium]